MNKLIYPWPVIRTLDDVLPAIAGRDEFFVADKVDHFVVNYQFNEPSTFACPNDEGIDEQERLFRAIRKECRGLIFDANRKLVSRPFHKFHNLNERPEYNIDTIDLSEDHVFLEKLDGSMIRPYYLDGKMYWGTKMGHNTEVADWATEFVNANPNYIRFAEAMLEDGLTPIFEYCSRKNRVVIDHPKDRLVLLAVRNMEQGHYMSLDHLDWQHYKIEAVDAFGFGHCAAKNLVDLVEATRQAEGTEGIVIRFRSGHMIKLKAEQYVLLHKTKDQLTLEKNVLRIVLEDKLDDMLPLIPEEDLKKRFIDYSKSVYSGIYFNAGSAAGIVEKYKDLSQKDFAIRVLVEAPELSSIIFKLRKEPTPENSIKLVVDYVLNHTSSITRVEEIRHLIGNAKWKEFYLEE